MAKKHNSKNKEQRNKKKKKNEEEEESRHETTPPSMNESKERSGYLRLWRFPAMVVLVGVGMQMWWTATTTTTDSSTIVRTEFADWFRRNGGWMSDRVELMDYTDEYGNGLRVVVSGDDDDDAVVEDGAGVVAIYKGQPLLRVPSSMQFSEQQSKQKFQKMNRGATDRILQSLYHENGAGGRIGRMEQQDMMMALDLMLECSLGKESFHYPYLSILPQTVPRLDLFSAEELDLLQDASLTRMTLSYSAMLRSQWDTLRSALHQLIESSTTGAAQANDDDCATWESFQRFVALVASRAMILQDSTKYLVPMADMMNHEPRNNDNDEESFTSFHVRDETSGTISVAADRDFPFSTKSNSPMSSSSSVLVEEYGKVDSSLFITVFGFVPNDNPYHCVLLPTPRWEDVDMGALWTKYYPPLDSVCVRKDKSLLEEGFGEKRLAMALSLDSNARAICLTASSRSEMDSKCATSTTTQQPKDDDKRNNYLRSAATKALSNAPTTLQHDQDLLRDMTTTTNHPAFQGMNPDHVALALRFRIEEKMVLSHIAA